MTLSVTLPASTTARPTSRMRAVSAVPTLARRRLALSVRSPRSVAVPMLTPVLFALVIAPALANTVASGAGRTAYMTYVALATIGLLIPLNCAFSGLGVIVDRQQGAMRELLVAPIRRSSIVVGNLVAALALTALQLAVLVGLSAARGADYRVGPRTIWFFAAAVVFAVLMYAVAEIMAVRLPSPEEYIGAVPAVAIVPFFFAGSLFPITALPQWLGALHNIWGLHSAPVMAMLSMLVLALYAVAAFRGAVRLFGKAGTS